MKTISNRQLPEHVPDELHFDFDLYDLSEDVRLREDTQKGLTFLHQQAPDIFFTTRNGGHWVVTRHALMTRILTDPEHFSSGQLTVPKTGGQPTLIPLTLDPPAHTPYRQILMRHFSPKRMSAMESDIRNRARALIADATTTSGGNFMESVAVPFPVFVFLDLMGLPTSKFRRFREIVIEWFAIPNGPRRHTLADEILGHLRATISERKRQRANDLISALIDETIDGRRLTDEELESMCFLLFLAGLDTVANGAGFMIERLAHMPELQKALMDSAELRKGFLEESLRTSGVVNTTRLLKSDFELEGVKMKAGELVLCPLALAGYDEKVNSSPLAFDASRETRSHLMFATGPHLCVGHFLARLELKILLEEWLRAVSFFAIDSGKPKTIKIGSITALLSLNLTWAARPHHAQQDPSYVV